MSVRRRSIHREENKDEGIMMKCNKCSDYFLISGNKTQTKVHDEHLTEWRELYRKKTGVYPDLAKVAPFCCDNCETKETPSFVQELFQVIRQASCRPGIMSTRWIKIGIFVVSLICLYKIKTYWTGTSFEVNMHEQSPSEIMLDDEIYNLDKAYSEQEDKVWFTLAAGIKSVLKKTPNQPSVFLMLFDSESAGHTAKCLAKDVSKYATKFLMEQSKTPVIVPAKNLNSAHYLEDPGYLLVYFNNTVRERGAMIVTDLQDVPPKVATHFHYFCDRYSPLVETAIYFFTLKVDYFSDQKISKTAEETMNKLWSGHVSENVLQPLITRMTSNLLKISSGSSNC